MELTFLSLDGPGSWYLLAKLRFRRSLSSPFSDDVWSLCFYSPGRPYCLDPERKIILRWNTFLGYLNFHSATFQRVGGWQRDAAMLEIRPHWNFQRELLLVLKTKISGHLRLRESSGVSLLARYVPSSSPILIFKKKKQAQAKGHFYLKPGEEGRNSSTEGWAVWWGVLLPVSASVPEDCEPVPFLHLETEPISSHLGEETLCCPGVNLKEGVLGSPEDTHMFGCPF